MHFALMKRPGLCASNYCDVERNTSSMTLEDLIKQDERKRKRPERERERAEIVIERETKHIESDTQDRNTD